MRWVFRALAAALVLTAAMGQAQPAAKRVALIVANANYGGYAPLPNPVTDAGLVRETLTRAGFTSIELKIDQDVAEFREVLSMFGRAAADADVALVYFAGHGVEAAGRNWLIPVDANLTGEADLARQGVDIAYVFAVMAGARTRIAVLDACRNNPFEAQLRARGSRSVGRGLGAPTAATGLSGPTRAGEAAQGALLMYSAAPGAIARDGPIGEGSPFARAFQKHFAEPEVELRIAIGNIATTVSEETARLQTPFSTMSLSGVPIVFVPERSAPPAPTTLGATFTDCAECPEMIVVPAGAYVRTSRPDPEPFMSQTRHRVTIARPFAVGKFEVTFAQWDACVAGGGCVEPEVGPWRPDDMGWGRGARPVTNVNWEDAKRYVYWLNRRVGGRAYRLLSDAEWEYAARGRVNGSEADTSYPWGAEASHEYANYGKEGGWPAEGLTSGRDQWEHTSPVGSFPPNGFGLFDMHGNVSEMVEDCSNVAFHLFEAATREGDAYVAAGCPFRVVRGGSWQSGSEALRSSTRGGVLASDRGTAKANTGGGTRGFRVARNLSDR